MPTRSSVPRARALLAVSTVVACAGGSPKPTAPVDGAASGGDACVNVAGEWRLEERADVSACGWSANPDYSTWTIDQIGCDLTIRERPISWPGVIVGDTFRFVRVIMKAASTLSVNAPALRVQNATFSGRMSARLVEGAKACDFTVDVTAARTDTRPDAGGAGDAL